MRHRLLAGALAVRDFIDRWVSVFVLAGLFALTGLGGVVLKLVEEQRASSQSQLVNRATNVESWCSGINAGRRYNRGFVRSVTGGRAAYTLAEEDCEALIRKTLESPKRKGPITEASNPITYRVLRKLDAAR